MSEVQVIPLGGAGEIGKNCTILRQGDDMIMVDCGLSFPDEEMLGVDIVIPDFTYVIENKDKLRGIFLTHAHEDHVGALYYLLPFIDAPIYTSELTHALIKPKLEERTGGKKVEVHEFKQGEQVKVGSLTVEPVRVTHSIPETYALAVRTNLGIVFFTADFKFDFTPIDNKHTNIARIGELAQEGILLLLSDSTNVDRPGWGPSENSVKEGLTQVFRSAPGRVLLTTFASNIHRMQQVFDVAKEMGRKVAIVGRRMEQNVDICSRLGYMNIPRGIRINLDEMKDYAPNQLAILTTGSQGEPMSALVQMSKETYSRLRIQSGDTLIYSARPIPGNEAAIWRTINRLFRQGVNVIYESPTPIHVSGHGHQEEIKMMISLTKPFYVAPVHGEPRHQHLYNELARAMGFPEHRCFTLSDGIPLHLDEKEAWIGAPVPCGRVLVDTSGTTNISDDVLKDRHSIAREGLVMITVVVDIDVAELVGEPILAAKGFTGDELSLNGAKEVLDDALRSLTKDDYRDVERVKIVASDVVRKYLQKKSNRRPLVVPTVVQV
jgi:ribonuclease J